MAITDSKSVYFFLAASHKATLGCKPSCRPPKARQHGPASHKNVAGLAAARTETHLVCLALGWVERFSGRPRGVTPDWPGLRTAHMYQSTPKPLA